MRDNLIKIGYASLNGIVIMIYAFSFSIFTSLFKFVPWHESSGMQFLAVLMLAVPALVITGCIILAYGKKLGTSKVSQSQSFVGALILSIIIILGSNLSLWMQIAGSAISALCIIIVLITTIKDIMAMKSPIHLQRLSK